MEHCGQGDLIKAGLCKGDGFGHRFKARGNVVKRLPRIIDGILAGLQHIHSKVGQHTAALTD